MCNGFLRSGADVIFKKHGEEEGANEDVRIYEHPVKCANDTKEMAEDSEMDSSSSSSSSRREQVPVQYVSMECSEEEEADEDASSVDSSDSMSESSSSDEDGEVPPDPSNPPKPRNTRLYMRLNNPSLAKPLHCMKRRARSLASNMDHKGSPPSQETSGKRQRFVVSQCWLCMFASCPLAKQISNFISANAASIDPAIMAQQTKAVVRQHYPNSKGIGRSHVLRHIREHMLAPNVRLANMVRSLLSLAETLRSSLHHLEGDMVLVDKTGTELYLKTLSQVLKVYKTDQSKLLFQGAADGSQQQANDGRTDSKNSS